MAGTRLTYITGLVLQALAQGHRYGFEIMDVTGLESGTVYPVLRRIHRSGWVRARWEDASQAHKEGRPRRRYYELTPLGEDFLETVRARFRNLPDRVPSSASGERRLRPGSAAGEV